MRWRPTLAALAVLGTVAALTVAMTSGSSPGVSASLDDPTPAETAPTIPDSAGGGPDEATVPAASGNEGGAEGRATADPVGPPDTTVTVPADRAESPPDESAVSPPGPTATPPEPGPTTTTPPTSTPPTTTPPTMSPTEPGSEFDCLPDPSDLSFSLYVFEDCYTALIAGEQQQELAEVERELLARTPHVAGHTAEPLGRPARAIRRGPSGEAGAPRFYLTFDDGPSARWTPPTLDLLDRYGARATFFPVGASAEASFHMIEEIVARGHTIGSHLWSHDRAALSSEELFRRELRASAELFGELGTTCLRTPFGIVNDDILEWAGDEGFEVVLWGEPDPRDWELPGTELLTQRMLGMQNGQILILHEHTGAETLAALETVLEALAAQGWRFDEPICPLQF